MDQIPVIDIAHGRPTQDVVADIYDAVVSRGFFQVVGHGVSPGLIDDAYDHFDALFALPRQEKTRWASPVGNPFRGYAEERTALGASATSEGFEITSIASSEEAARRGLNRYFDGFRWPDLPGFQGAVTALFEATKSVGWQLMSLFARALGLPPRYFSPMLDNDVSNYACKHYAALADVSDTAVVIKTEHSDSGMLTLLHQRGNYDGLQVLSRDGNRTTVPVRDDAFVVNVGRLMTRWTNGLFPATPHRVVAPPRAGKSRKSLVLFYLPAVDTVIEPLSVCVGADGPHYEPTTPYAEQVALIGDVEKRLVVGAAP